MRQSQATVLGERLHRAARESGAGSSMHLATAKGANGRTLGARSRDCDGTAIRGDSSCVLGESRGADRGSINGDGRTSGRECVRGYRHSLRRSWQRLRRGLQGACGGRGDFRNALWG